MKRLTYLIAAVAFLFSLAVISDGCKKEEDPYYISNEDFIKYMNGEWKVTQCLGPDIWISWFIEDTLRYDYRTSGIEDEKYSINDIGICSLPEIEKIQVWTFSNSGEELLLETKDLCGVTRNFKVVYSKLWEFEQGDPSIFSGTAERVKADIQLTNKDSTVYLDDFTRFTDSENMDFYIWISDIRYAYYFKKQ